MNVYQKLNAAREKFHTLKLKKTGHNKFAGYDYFELGDFLLPAMKVFSEHGLCGTVSFDADKACMIVRNVEKPDEYITFYSPMGSANLKGCHEVQNIGAVETYQRRYLWVAALEIVEHDALDATTGAEPKGTLKAVSPAAEIANDWASNADPKRLAELDELALHLIDSFQAGSGMLAASVYYGIQDNEEKVYVWNLLKAESKLRSFLKANRPTKDAA